MADLRTEVLALLRRVETARGDGGSADDLVTLVLDSGWRPRLPPEPGVEHVDGVLADGRHVLVSIRRGRAA